MHAISQTGLALIQEYEGFRAEPAQLPDGNWVVGHGHVRIGDAGDAVNENEAAELLALDLAPVERSVNTLVTTSLTQSQFDALVSFAFSIGLEQFENSQVLRRVNGGSAVAAACAMDAWRKSDITGELEIIDALVRRRAAEKALFLKDTTGDVTPSVFMRAKLDHAASILGAPVNYSPAPAVGSIPVAVAKPEATQRLSEILMSEPATEALMLTRVATEEEVAAFEADEIVTAHAKPRARKLDRATLRSIPLSVVEQPKRASFVKAIASKFAGVKLPRIVRPTETVGLGALFLFGGGLIALGFSQLIGPRVDVVDVLGASALAAPGLAAVFMATFGLVRGPATAKAAA